MANTLTFVGHRAFDGLSFALNAPVDSLLCCDSAGSAAKVKEEFGVNLFSLEPQSLTRECWTSAHTDILVKGMWPQLPDTAKSNPFAAYSSSRFLEEMVEAGTISMLYANREKLKLFFDNKIVSKRIFRSLGLPALRSKLFRLAPAVFTDQAAPLVVRKLYSSLGTGIFRIEDAAMAYDQLTAQGAKPGEAMLMEEFLEGTPINVNGCIVGNEIYAYQPSVQLIGLADYTSLRFGFCGNDYARGQLLGDEVIRTSKEQLRQVGQYLIRAGYKGIFGMDQIVSANGNVVPCEINPRFQSSTALLNWSHKGRPTSPAALYMAAFTKDATTVDLPENDRPTPFSQIIVHALDHEIGFATGCNLTEARYKMDAQGNVTFIEHTLDVLRLEEGEILVTGSPAQVGTILKKDASLFTAIVKSAVTENGTSIASKQLQAALANLKQQLHMRPAS